MKLAVIESADRCTECEVALVKVEQQRDEKNAELVDLMSDLLTAEQQRDELMDVLRYCNDELNVSVFSVIGHGSAIHRKIQESIGKVRGLV